MPRRSHRLQYLVRELYREPNRHYEHLRGFIAPEAGMIVASKMSQAHLYLDGAKTAYPFLFGARAGFRIADSPLRLFIWFAGCQDSRNQEPCSLACRRFVSNHRRLRAIT